MSDPNNRADWVWMPHPAHFICSYDCRFHLATYLPSGYIVSTVGEWWSSRSSREIHAKIYDLAWHFENNHLKGDAYEHAYMERFGYEEIGPDRKFETMVFEALPMDEGDCEACPWGIAVTTEADFKGYNDAKSAYDGHLALCEKWSRPHAGLNDGSDSPEGTDATPTLTKEIDK